MMFNLDIHPSTWNQEIRIHNRIRRCADKLDHDAAWTGGGGGPPHLAPARFGSTSPLPACIPPAAVKRQGVIRRDTGPNKSAIVTTAIYRIRFKK